MDEEKSQNPAEQDNAHPPDTHMIRPESGSHDPQGADHNPKQTGFWRSWTALERCQVTFNFLLVVVTGMYTFVSCQQWSLMEDSLGLTRRAIEIADIQAQAAQDANALTRENIKTATEAAHQTFMASQRAWLGPSAAHLDSKPVVGDKLTVSIIYQNTGREPARNVYWELKTSITPAAMEAPRGLVAMRFRQFFETCQALQ